MLKLEYIGQDMHARAEGGGIALLEVVVPRDARIEGRSAMSVQLLARHGVTLLGVSRQGKPFRDRVRKLEIKAGDILLLLGPEERVGEVGTWLGCLPLAERGLTVARRDKALALIGIFAAAIIAASLGLVYLPVALAAVVVCLCFLGHHATALNLQSRGMAEPCPKVGDGVIR